ncbi:MAG: hypothetical protein Q6363_006590 [Candidatus Njordarchaeota archaeon]
MSTVAIVLDTSTIFRGAVDIIEDGIVRNLESIDRIFYFTTHSVISEIKSKKSEVLVLTIMHKITVLEPSRRALVHIKKVASETGDISKLSETDIDVLALALDLMEKYERVIVASEDYAVQNLCLFLGISIISIRKKIRYIVEKRKKCKNCSTIYISALEECPSCGSSDFTWIIKKRKWKK